MTYTDRRNNRILLIIAIVMALFWVLFAVATILEWDYVYNFSSPIISFLATFLLFIAMKDMGIYAKVARWFMIGIFIWFLGDIAWVIECHLLPENEVMGFLTDNLYLIPDFFYVVGLLSYAKIRFQRNDYRILIVDAFFLASVTFVASQGVFHYLNPDYKMTLENLNSILYFFVTVFTLLVVFLLLLKTGFQDHAVPFFLLGGAVMLNEVLEIRFTAMKFLGKESESVVLDILYMLFIVIISMAFSLGKLRDVQMFTGSRMGNKESFTRRHFQAICVTNASIVVIIAIGMRIAKILDESDTFFIVIIAMAYVIMCKSIEANVLSEELIQQQKNENSRLEQMVEEKTRELREMNVYLEKISNTDALTGLYNRRYGIEYFSGLIQNGENYPIALYSLDLNYFKPINDNYGHDMGDVVLREVGHRLSSLGQKRCTAIRIGGDEFLVIFRNASNKAAIQNVGQLIASRMDEPIHAHVVSEEKGEMDHTFQISASIGVAEFPADTADMDTLFKMADQALYQIKHKHEKSAFLLYSEMSEKQKNEAASGK